jgi:hypothetical protein
MYSGSLGTESKKVCVPRAAVRDDKKKGFEREAVSPDFRFERTFSKPVDWPWSLDISGTITMATT